MNKKLHILFLCGWYPSRVLPNNGDFIQRHAEAVTLKHTVSVLHIVSDKNILKTEISIKNINEIQTYIGYVKHSNNPILKFIRFYLVYKEFIKKINAFDVIHLNILFPLGIIALHQKWFLKIPFIISEHWSGYLASKAKKISFLQKLISKLIVKKASFVCPVSKNLAESMQSLGLKGNYNPVPNVVDTNLFQPIKKIEKHFTIIHISNMAPLKNVPKMLEVAKKLENDIGNFTWKFIGNKKDAFSSLIKELKFKTANIKFIDHLPQKELVKELQSASILVLFSDYESLPCVILEAFSCGIPVISSNVGGIKEYFPSNFGFLIEKGNSKELSKKIKMACFQEMATKSEMHFYATNHFSKEKIASNFTNLYYKVLKKES